MQSLTDAKAIVYDRHEREFAAYFDGELIGFFASYLAAECALNDHALRLIEDGLADLPLALLDDPQPAPEPTPPQPRPEPRPFPAHWSNDPWDDGPSQEEQQAAAARWTECEGGWEQFAPHPFDPTKTGRLFQPRI